MGQLSGFKYREIVRILKQFGFEFYCQAAGGHEIWFSPQTQKFTTIPKFSRKFTKTLRAILRQAGISVEDFLAKK